LAYCALSLGQESFDTNGVKTSWCIWWSDRIIEPRARCPAVQELSLCEDPEHPELCMLPAGHPSNHYYV